MKYILSASLLIFSLSSLAHPHKEANYSTFCKIRDGKAHGYVRTTESLTFSGKVYFESYDEDGDLLDSDWEIAIVIVVGADVEKVEETKVSDSATSCSLNIDEAVND